MRREILFVRVAFAKKENQKTVIGNENTWAVRKDGRRESKRRKNGKAENVGH